MEIVVDMGKSKGQTARSKAVIKGMSSTNERALQGEHVPVAARPGTALDGGVEGNRERPWIALVAVGVVADRDARLRGRHDDVWDAVVRVLPEVGVKEVAAAMGGRGGGKPHLAQGGGDPEKLEEALAASHAIIARLLEG